MAVLILGARKFLLCFIVVNSVPEYVVHKLDDVRGGTKVNLMIRAVSMGRFSQTVRYLNPKQRGIQPHIYGSTGLVKDGVCALIIYLDTLFSRVLLWVMQFSRAGGDVVLAHDL